MVFSSIFFIFCFLPPFLLLYYLVPEKFRNILLFIGSLIFYAWGDPIYVVLMLFSSFFNYYMALEIDHLDKDPKGRKKNLIFAVTINLLILGFFKYWGFLLDTFSTITGISIAHPQLALPIGISFYTFKNLSYILDVSKKKVSPQRKFLTYAVYSTMFPHMSAGPIVRYADIEGQLTRRSISLTRLGLGAEYFTKGLAKKVLLADNLSAIYTSILSSGSNSVLTAWIGILAYTLQLYFDFSGYSDMAIGLGKMMGFDFLKNFDYPYISTSVSEFWRRWHISLGSWFRDYIYIPLGGNRVSVPKHIRNIFVVWALTGLWHGASWTFVVWGLWHGLFLLIEEYVPGLKKLPKFFGHLYTMLVVTLGFVLFRADTFSYALGYFGAMFFGFDFSSAHMALFFEQLTPWFLVMFVVAIIGCAPIRPLAEKVKEMIFNPSGLSLPWKIVSVALYVLAFIGLVWCIVRLSSGGYHPFIYFRF